MVEIGKRLNRSITSVITSMEQPLGMAVGNSLEVIESINTLKNQGPEDIEELCLYLGAVALKRSDLASSVKEGEIILKKYLEDGSAFEKFKELVKVQHGDVEALENYNKLPKAATIYPLKSGQSGFVEKVDALKIAKACKVLGAGREKKEDQIDHAVGIVLNKKIGHQIEEGEVLAYIHANSQELLEKAIEIAQEAFVISDTKIAPPELVLQIIE
jgi:pyrimidine-nucleoside phosphorylase